MSALTEMLQKILVSHFPVVRIQLVDVLDIAILSLLIYKLMWMLRKSSSGRLLRGIGILLAAMVLSSAIQLTAVSYLLDQVVELGILALIILFQPEIRRMLEQVGNGRLGMVFASTREPGQELETAIAQTTEAYADLSRDKVGALMVFERQNLLDDIIKTGTALDCAISSELLKNIFWNKAPLHDGAVIVRGGRIVGAGCMLPLSGNVNLSRELGMRHRAGIGVSENSDAVVAIVSEETGSISVAVNGMLKRHLSPETLERVLRLELMPAADESSKPTAAARLTSVFKGKKGDNSNGKEDS